MNFVPVVLAAALTCDLTPAKTDTTGNPAFRTAAQRGLTFMSSQARTWTEAHPNCYGCHVHSVTLEGLSIGKHNRYDVSLKDMQLMAKAMLSSEQGVHATTFTTARAFGGVAFARYDQLVDGALTHDLLTLAKRLVEDQAGDGSVKVDDTRFPIESGVMQATFQAMQTWRQAYARTADDTWLTPLRKAEEYIQVRAQKNDGLQLQDQAYALMGLTAAGVGNGEKLSLSLQRALTAQQNHDGGWGFVKAKSDAFATGQVLYALRGAGISEKEPSISRAMSWLVERQQKTGGWGGAVSNSGGSALGEAMWAVMGLVTVDVMTVAVNGLVDGQHVDPTMKLEASAKDNKTGQVRKVELVIDDLAVHAQCGESLSYTWDTAKLTPGKHLVDIIATNGKSETSRRRFEVYAGNVFLTQVGSRFDANRQVTELTARDIDTAKHQVQLEVLAVDTKDGQPVPGKVLFTRAQGGEPGPLTLTWNGAGTDGKPLPKGRYFARVTVKDAEGKAVQAEQVLVFHDREEAQKEKFAEVAGNLSLKAEDSANTEVELVDENDRVVQTTRSTAQGSYRFKNVDEGKYKVRAKKAGFKDLESAPVQAAPAAPAATVNLGW